MRHDPPFVLVVAADLVRDGVHLLHLRPAHKEHGGLWEFPGGKVDAGEAPRMALVRELFEELGVEVDAANLTHLGFAESDASGDRPGILLLLYRCARWRGEPKALEGGEVQWFPYPQMLALPMPPLDRMLCTAITNFAEPMGIALPPPHP